MPATSLQAVPFGALALMILVGILLVDIQIDSHASHEVALAYYRTTQIPYPLGLALLGTMAVAALDLIIMTIVRPSRIDIISSILAGYLLYLYVGAIQPQLQQAVQDGASDFIIKEALATLKEVHLHMLPTIVILMAAISIKRRVPVMSVKKSN